MSTQSSLDASAAGSTDAAREALRRAAALEDEGRPLEAIDVLTGANRIARDHAVERRLVEVRHRAVPLVEAQPVQPAPLGDVEVATGAAGLPEVDRSGLTSSALASAITSHGALVVRGFADLARVAQLTEDIDRAFEAFDTQPTAPPDAESRNWYVPFNPPSGKLKGRLFVRNAGAVWTADSPPALFDVFEACENAGLRDVLTGYFGARPVVTVNKTSLRRVDTDAYPAWHQDGSFMGRGIRTVNLWITLTDCGDGHDTPSLELVPRRFDDVLETGTEGAFMADQVGEGVVARVTQDTPALRPEFKAGDAVLFDDLFLHRTSVAEGNLGRRHTIECWFFAPSRHPEHYCPLVF
ncbi:MAG: phytanoyl-CoA dioxygenase family protein [Acidimicrobiales bacterium]|jgi:hypothetical protein|nr:phytanoyl-CoA dioxygenase family protein [Acidimicrobiales bacterium]